MPIADQLAVAIARDRHKKHHHDGVANALSSAPNGVRYLNRAQLDNPEDLRAWQAAKRLYRQERKHFGDRPAQLAMPSQLSAKEARNGVMGYYDPEKARHVVFLDDDTRKALAAAAIGRRPEASQAMIEAVELHNPGGSLYQRMHPSKTVTEPKYPGGRDEQGRPVANDLRGLTTQKTRQVPPPAALARMVTNRARDWQLREGLGTLVHELAHTNQRAIRAQLEPGYRPPANVKAEDARLEGGADAFDRLFTPQIARQARMGRLADTPDLTDYARLQQQVLEALGRRWVSRGQFGAPR